MPPDGRHVFFKGKVQMITYLRSYAYELVRKGEIPVLMLGKKRVVPKEKFNRWVNGEEELEK